jgi:hypothetical protein
MASRYQDPDELLVVLFKHIAVHSEARSLAEGRPIFEDIEVCEIRSPGSPDVKIFPSTEVTRWVTDPITRQQRTETYAERFRHQYQQFKRDLAQTKIGTPLDLVPFLTDARRAELRAQNVYTIEQLAGIDGEELKNLGPGGREMKNKADEYIKESMATAPNMQLLAQLEQLRARNVILEEDAAHKKSIEQATGSEFDNMDLTQLREYIATHSGQKPIGAENMNRKTLVRMAESVRPEKVA